MQYKTQSQTPSVKSVEPFSVTFKTAQAMLKLIQTSDNYGDVGIVHTGKRRIKLAAEKVPIVTVKVNTVDQFKDQDLLLVPSEEPTLPEGVTVAECLITVPSDRSGYLKIPIASTNKQDITLDQRTVVGHLQTFKTTYAVRTEKIYIGERGKQQDSK